LIGGGGDVPFIKGVERVLVHGEKRKGIGRLLERFFLSDPLYHCFLLGMGNGSC
jgi:hypothetical protein